MLKKIGYIVASLMFLWLIYFSGYQQGILHQPNTPTPLELNADTIFNLVNDWRITQNLTPFKKLNGLCDAGKVRVYEIKRDWSHNGFEYLRIRQFSGYASGEFGENLADFTWGTEEEVLAKWINSPSHLKNIKDNYIYSCVVTDGGRVVELLAK